MEIEIPSIFMLVLHKGEEGIQLTKFLMEGGICVIRLNPLRMLL